MEEQAVQETLREKIAKIQEGLYQIHSFGRIAEEMRHDPNLEERISDGFSDPQMCLGNVISEKAKALIAITDQIELRIE